MSERVMKALSKTWLLPSSTCELTGLLECIGKRLRKQNASWLLARHAITKSMTMPTGDTPEVWPDGTPILREAEFPEPWGSDPRDRWVRVMAKINADGVWDVTGCGRCCDELPIPEPLVDRIRAWQEWHDREDNAAWLEPAGKGNGGKFLYWEQHPGKPVAAFNAEGRAIGRALKDVLGSGWTVIVHDFDTWLRPADDEDWCVILR